MQHQIQRFLEEYFENPKSSNKKTIESNKPSVSNGNGTTTLKRKGILQEKDKTENLDHYEDITKPVMSINAQKMQASTTELTNEQMKFLNLPYPGIPIAPSKPTPLGRSKLQLTLWDLPKKTNARVIQKNLSFYGRALVKRQGTSRHNEKGNLLLLHKARMGCRFEQKPDKENIQPVGIQSVKGKNILNKQQTDNLQPDNNRFNIKENQSNHTGHTEPNEKSMMDLLCNIMNRLEIIETLGKLIREVKRNRISAKYLPVEVWNNQIRHINHLAETKVNKFPHSREDLEGWLTKLDEKVWRSNVAINTIEQCKNLDLIFDIVKGSWHLQENGPTIISMLDSKSEKQSKQPRIDLVLFFVRQLLDCSGRNLLTWQQVKTARGANCRGKVPLWFQKLEELLIDDAEKKSAFIENWTEMHVQGDKYRLLKCRGCNLNTKGKENGCMISCNKNLIRSAAVGITKGENNWITNFSTTLLKDKPEYPLTPVQECPLLQLKEIDYAE
ncbi:19835_t:CDS:2, partial [Gigaspora margarita]